MQTMIKLERNDAMAKAIIRAKLAHPKVSIINAAQRLYRVAGRQGNSYTVRFAVANGLKLAACDCPAGQAGQLCYHVAAAAAVNIGLAAPRQRAAA
jgi:uncharacterized Zn finger protein